MVVCVSHFLYIFLCLWIFGLLPCLGYCKQCCNEYWVAGILSNDVFSRYMSMSGLAGTHATSIFSVFKELPQCSP